MQLSILPSYPFIFIFMQSNQFRKHCIFQPVNKIWRSVIVAKYFSGFFFSNFLQNQFYIIYLASIIYPDWIAGLYCYWPKIYWYCLLLTETYLFIYYYNWLGSAKKINMCAHRKRKYQISPLAIIPLYIFAHMTFGKCHSHLARHITTLAHTTPPWTPV